MGRMLGRFFLGLAFFGLWGTGLAALPPAVPQQPDLLQLKSASGSSYLYVPQQCYRQECALVIISHPRDQNADRLLNSPQVAKMVGELLGGPFAVLLSNDAGVNTWGSPQALAEVAQVRQEAVRHFAWSERTYALGLSMGGIMALRSALPGSPYQVNGVALIDAWVDLRQAWGTSLTRRKEIVKAYGTATAPTPQVNPLNLFQSQQRVPVLLFASPDDKIVPMEANAAALRRALPNSSKLLQLDGPHLGANRFSGNVTTQIRQFFQQLEVREQAYKKQ